MAEREHTSDDIDELVRKSGKSRATVYRKIAEGWADSEIIRGRKSLPSDLIDDMFPSTPAPAKPVVKDKVVLEPPTDDVKFAVTWAHAVLWAADNVDTQKKKMTKAQAGSALRYNLFLLGKDDLRELHVNLVPKALNILDKNKNPEGGNIAAIEETNANELLATLKIALEESNRQWVERN